MNQTPIVKSVLDALRSHNVTAPVASLKLDNDELVIEVFVCGVDGHIQVDGYGDAVLTEIHYPAKSIDWDMLIIDEVHYKE